MAHVAADSLSSALWKQSCALLCLLVASLALIGCGGKSGPASPLPGDPGFPAQPTPGGSTASPITILSAPIGRSVADGRRTRGRSDEPDAIALPVAAR